MRPLSSMLSLLSLCVAHEALPAQTDWVTNGSFTGTLAPWVMGGGYGLNPGLEGTWDTTGTGVSDSFGVNAGGQSWPPPPPYAPNTIEQQVLLVQGLVYEFRADLSGACPGAPGVQNAHTGRVWVELDNVQIALLDLGAYIPVETKRAQVVGRHVGHTTGMVTLRISFQRDYVCDPTTPRMNLDNVSLKDATGPTFWLDGDRKVGTTVPQRVTASPGSLFATFVAVAESPVGIPIPGVVGLLAIDPTSAVSIGAGIADTSGAGVVPLAVPNAPALLTTPLYYQAVGADVALSLSLHFGCVFTQ